jgi:transglutaminase-like putative cysteine protease
MKNSTLTIVLLAFIFLSTHANAITYPKSISYLKAKVILSGEVDFLAYPSSFFKKAYIYVYIPQEDGRQKVKILSVQPSIYELVKDEYGNAQIKLIIPEFKEKVYYKIETLVEVEAKHSSNNISFIRETELTKPTPEILSKALEIGGNTIDKLAEVAIWVNNYVKYDKTLENETKPASWVFENRKGTCDEFSSLFISLTRAWKIPFRYSAGIAYSDRFERHAWVELLINNSWIPFDPTWAQANYLDATHIKIANLPDANFSEKIEVESKNIGIDWVKPTNYKVEILESKEESPIEIKAKLLNEEIGGGYFLLESEITPKECLIANLKLTSCSLNGESVFYVFDKKDVWLCENRKVYWVGKLVTELKKGYMYTCPLMLATDFGNSATVLIKIDLSKGVKGIKVFPEKVITLPNTPFKISVTTELKHFYLLYLDRMEEIKEIKVLNLTSLNKEGNYKIFFIGPDGSGDYLELSVSKLKLVKILKVEIPSNFTKGIYYLVNVSIQNIGNKSLEGKLSLTFDEKIIAREISISPDEILKETFNLSFENVGKGEIRVILDVNEDRDIEFFEVEVLSKESEFPNFILLLMNLLKKLIDYLQGLTKNLFQY